MDSFKSATIDMPKTQIWKQMNTMSSRFVFLTLATYSANYYWIKHGLLTVNLASSKPLSIYRPG